MAAYGENPMATVRRYAQFVSRHRLTSRPLWIARAARLALDDPIEGIDRAAIRLRLRRPPASPRTTPDWRERVHEVLGVDWPCPESEEFAPLFEEVRHELEEQGLAVGRGAYGGWDDADAAFASAVWCLAAHSHARVAVETGVARGLTSRLLLESCERRGEGRVWSVDQPPLDTSLHGEIGSAVPDRLRFRWTYVRGTSRRSLPSVLERARPLDLFVHDSLHSTRNVMFELDRVWPALAPGAVAIVDDVHRNRGFARFVAANPDALALVAEHADGQGAFGVLIRPRGLRPAPAQAANR